MARNIKEICDHYKTAVIFTESGDENIGDCTEFAGVAEDQIKNDVQMFLILAANYLTPEWSDQEIGHCLWLTRNRHGSGFWDRDFPNADKLSDIARDMGEQWAIADGDLIYLN